MYIYRYIIHHFIYDLCVFILGKTAILSGLGTFITIDEDDSLIAKNKKASDAEYCTIRSSASRVIDTKSNVPSEERGNLDEIEENYV